MNKRTENGSHLIIIIVIVVGILIALGAAFFFAVQNKGNSKEPDLKLKSIGINLDYYNSTTNHAGDLVFTKTGIEQGGNILFSNFGELSKASSARAGGMPNPQPTFIVPLGTKIRSLVDGVVVRVEKLYSDDYTIQVASSTKSNWIYEIEHVMNQTVKVGDTVKGGQVIAEASTHDSQYHPGFGIYETGILHAGNPPEHVCLFNYLDDSIKEDTFAKLRGLFKSWEAYMGNSDLYDEAKMVVPGCYTLDAVSDTNRGAN
jgi:biotin carboxyl carrier protein